MKKISAEIVADSINPQGDRITTMLLTYPRFIHGELLTHRVFSKNSASSRAIPFETMVKMVEEDPFIPIAWQKDHKGMQGNEYFTGVDIETNNKVWIQARDNAIRDAVLMNQNKVTKQLCNRLLEPFMWHTVLLTGTEFENFFELRCPRYEIDLPISNDRNEDWKTFKFKSKKDLKKEVYSDEIDNYDDLEWLQINSSQAEIHIQALAEAMWDAMNESIPKTLQSGQWHIPFGDKIDYALHKWNFLPNMYELWGKDMSEYGIKVSTARCARLSYMTFDGAIDYEKDIKLHDRLLADNHMSPFEHCARAMSDEEYMCNVKGQLDMIDMDKPGSIYIADLQVYEDSKSSGWSRNFKGFIPYRHLIES